MKRRPAIILISLLFSAALLYSLLRPAFCARMLLSPFERKFGVTVRFERAEMHPFKSLIIHGAKLNMPGGTAMCIGKAQISFYPWDVLSGNTVLECDLRNLALNEKAAACLTLPIPGYKGASRIDSAFLRIRPRGKRLMLDWMQAAGQAGSVCGYGYIGADNICLNLKAQLFDFLTAQEGQGPLVIYVRISGSPGSPYVKIVSEKFNIEFKGAQISHSGKNRRNML